MQESLHHDDPEQLLAQGIEAIKASNHSRAREVLARAIQLNPADERIWLWMSGAVETDNDRRRCLERVLQLNPGNQAAQRGLAAITAAASAPSPVAPPVPPVPARTAEPGPAIGPPVRAAEPAQPAAVIGPPVRAAEPAQPADLAQPPITLSPLHIPDSAASIEHAPPANSPLMRRLSEQPATTASPAASALPASPEARSGVLVMADLEKLRSSTQPPRSWPVRPLVIVLLVLVVVIVVLAVLFAPQLLGLA